MIYVISGMVRAGTSMMAEALKQGGIPLLYDENVPNTDPEDDFPHNTYDLPTQYDMAQNPESLNGCAIKFMVSSVCAIPKQYRNNVKVIWMTRKAKSVLMSVKLAAEHRGQIREIPTPREARRVERFWSKRVIEYGFNVMIVKYEECVKHPASVMSQVNDFLQYPDFDLGAAVAVVDPRKWRQR